MSHDELVDIVDENEKKIGQTSKYEAHVQGLLHKTVIAEIIDSKDRWLLVKQASDRQDAGQYVSPVGGHVTAGETNEEALKREAFEEVGFEKLFRYELAGKAIFNRRVIGRQENHYFIVYKIYSDSEPKLNHESIEYRYFTQEELVSELRSHPKHFGDAFHFLVKKMFPELLT